MASNTYVALDKVTISGSSTSTFTFSSIPQGYTDLIIVEQATGSASGYSTIYFNSDNASTNYSWTYLFGNGTNTYSGRVTNQPTINSWDYIVSGTTVNSNIYQLSNYSNNVTNKNIMMRYNTLADGVWASIGLWRSTAPITSVTFTRSTGTYTSGSTYALYGIAALGVSPAAKATGGTIYSDADYFYHVFAGNGNFVPTTSVTADILCIAGGGGGSAGGGGAGGLLGFTSQTISTSTAITVGAGGASSSAARASNGTNSQFGALTASVGGGGGGYINANAGASGGSGGGGGTDDSTGYAGGSGTSGQGYAGGNGYPRNAGYGGGGGGGGAGSAGGSADYSTNAGNGGNGVNTYASWATATGTGVNGYYAGGGGGGSNLNVRGLGGLGGGGNGWQATPNTAGAAGVAYTGSGGGAVWNTANSYPGGSGIVIVRYAK